MVVSVSSVLLQAKNSRKGGTNYKAMGVFLVLQPTKAANLSQG
jgi:hypothetical protein